ncbi:MAG: DHH family phosphoesterase [Muribaculaceae bacterium]|nr:DHH family phosphoesterase [Muribaculaceae bacterium]
MAYIHASELERLKELVSHAGRVAIVCHMTPDGDAIGSSLCLWHTLLAMGKEPVIVTPDAIPADLTFLPGADRVVIASYMHTRAEGVLRGADLVFCLDFNEPARVDRMSAMLMRAKAPKVMIDHHLNPQPEFCDVTFSVPESSSTCLLLYRVLEAEGWDCHVGRFAAECCIAGMMTDTGNFSYNANDPEIYRVLGALMQRGVDKDALYKRLFDTSTERRIRLMGYAQYKKMIVIPERSCALITLSVPELKEFGYHKGDTEGLVNCPLSMPEIKWSIYLRESEEGYVKVSMRSKGDFSVRDICAAHFGGGGHVNASGGEVRGSMQEAFDRVLEVIHQYNPSEHNNSNNINIEQ